MAADSAAAGSPKTTAAATMVELAGVSKRYGPVDALFPVDLAIGKGEFVTLLGPSGSGKSTLLNLIAGMISPTTGKITIDGKDATAMPTNARGLGMVFQNYALMPHMTVFENIAFPLQVRRMSRSEIRERVEKVLDLIQLRHVADRRPKALSGGQQQRISLARCIVYNPALILMDEPLGALDKNLREQMQLEIKRLHAELGITMLYVTHDQDEALTMSDRIVLMNGGRIEQQGRPEQLYFEPSTVFSAQFIGSSNLIAGTVAELGSGAAIRTTIGTFPVAPGSFSAGEPAMLLVRPENLLLVGDDTELPNITGRLEDSIVMGGVIRHFVRCSDSSVVIVQELNQPGQPRPARGAVVRAGWNAGHGRLLPPTPTK
ncbi:ABC transporter ATP-binding protein [Aliidongia dinghuensis]|nr:ABC transporter ATP-binding protein [Aliidongia dinghuensis]